MTIIPLNPFNDTIQPENFGYIEGFEYFGHSRGLSFHAYCGEFDVVLRFQGHFNYFTGFGVFFLSF